jgi:hypothetical protein
MLEISSQQRKINSHAACLNSHCHWPCHSCGGHGENAAAWLPTRSCGGHANMAHFLTTIVAAKIDATPCVARHDLQPSRPSLPQKRFTSLTPGSISITVSANAETTKKDLEGHRQPGQRDFAKKLVVFHIYI